MRTHTHTHARTHTHTHTHTQRVCVHFEEALKQSKHKIHRSINFACQIYSLFELILPISVVGASLKKPCTPNEIYTFGIMHKSFL